MMPFPFADCFALLGVGMGAALSLHVPAFVYRSIKRALLGQLYPRGDDE